MTKCLGERRLDYVYLMFEVKLMLKPAAGLTRLLARLF